MADNHPNLFLSHSSSDKEFARQLAASLLAVSVNVFLDEKDILVGDSIPEKIYKGIESSTHLIYIVSKNSVNSKWVKEELSIAKMREKQFDGFKILPVIIDDVELPTSIIHIKYADFRQWRNAEAYRQAFLQILQSMNIEPRLLDNSDLSWYSQRSAEIRETQRVLFTVYAEITGGLDATQMSPVTPFMNIKNAFIYWEIEERLKTLRDDLLSGINMQDSSRLSALKHCTNDVLEFINSGFRWPIPRSQRDDLQKVEQFRRLLIIVVNMLEEIRTELEVVLLAPVTTS